MAFGNADYDQLLATTLANHGKELTDNVFRFNPLVNWFERKGLIDKNTDGGHSIVEPILGDDGQAESYGEWDALTLTPQEGITAAVFPWRQVYASIVISGLQEFQNSGKYAMVKLLKAKSMQASKTLSKKLETMLWSDGTGNSNKDFMGLDYVVGDSTVSPAIVGGIDSSDPLNAFWASSVYDKSAVSLGSGATSSLAAWFRTAYNDTSDGSEHVDTIFTDQDTHEHYESTLTPNVRYEDVETADAGFISLLFKDVAVVLAKTAPAQTAWGLNKDYIALEVAADRWMTQSKFSEGLSAASGGVGTTVDARYAHITSYGNIKTNKRSAHFRIVGIGATA
jgi:hypothetical protein